MGWWVLSLFQQLMYNYIRVRITADIPNQETQAVPGSVESRAMTKY